MDEYIEREALMRRIKEIHCAECDSYHGVRCRACWVDDTLDYIDSEPAADVAPVRHGRWIFGKDLPYSWGQIPKNKYHLYCSECLEQAFNPSEDNDHDFDADTSYCPNCGAKMDGGDGNSAVV